MFGGLSVILPTLNEEKNLPASLHSIRREAPQAEIIIADGGSTDGTRKIGERYGIDKWLETPPGRGRQLREGALAARGDWFLFIHADTRLGLDAGNTISAFCRPTHHLVANFRLHFDEEHWLLKLSAASTWFDSVFTRFGDQGILIRRDFYEQLGGFPQWPLFEDVELLRRARRKGRIPSLLPPIVTSARRFRTGGRIKQQCRNAILLTRFLLGTSPERLAAEYNQPRSQAIPSPRKSALSDGLPDSR